MLQCCNISNGYFILQNYISPDKILPLVKNTILENYDVIADDPIELKEMLLTEAEKITPGTSTKVEDTLGTVPVDHAFNVKGIGAVILGVVTKGVIKVHSSMNVLPGIKTTQIRSIQKHDDNFDLSSEGDRVGLALKNIKVGDIDRGTVLTSDPAVKSSRQVKAVASLVNYWTLPIKDGMVLHLGHWMQVLNSKVEAVSDDGDWRKPKLTLSLEKEIIHRPGDLAVLMYLEGGKLRVAGTIELP
jgi:selenocysteine-specific translation elongation factor